MKQRWENLLEKIDGMTVRERVLIFAAAGFLLITLVNKLLIEPQLVKQKLLSDQIVQKQEKIKEVRAQLEELVQAKNNDANSPLRKQLVLSRQQIAEGDNYLQALHDRLVTPEKMASLLQQMLKKNGQLELLSLQSLPAAPLIASRTEGAKSSAAMEMSQQVYTHRVKITVRGSYKELLQYLSTLETLPTQMFWGNASMKVVQPTTADLTLTLYTLSLNKTWMQI
jgi:MSHA biogenesis protein MshJ